MLVLGIESSCDETSIAILEVGEFEGENILENFKKIKVIESVVSSQIEVHREFGGVIPEIGAREHSKNIWLTLELVLKRAEMKDEDLLSSLKYIFVTNQPGLASALRVGQEFAKAVAFFAQIKYHNLPQVRTVNHLHGHVASCFFNFEKSLPKVFPHLHLLVSGGNSQLIYLKSWKEKQIIGQTIDDAGGECMDKIGRMLGLAYPGGIGVARISKFDFTNPMNLPVGMLKNQDSDNFNFSFSGLKTAVRYLTQKQEFSNWKFEKKLSDKEIALVEGENAELPDYLDFIKKTAISTQTVVIKQLLNQVKKAVQKFGFETFGLSGGVSANPILREKLETEFGQKMLLAPRNLTGDNAVMIALAGILDLRSN